MNLNQDHPIEKWFFWSSSSKIGLATTTVSNTKIREFENRIPDNRNLATTTVSNTKISEAENKIPKNYQYITTKKLIS